MAAWTSHALRRALNEIVARHESLRTTFPASRRRPMQSIAPQVACDLPLIDLTSVPAGRREAEVRRLATEQAREPFDLARGPSAAGATAAPGGGRACSDSHAAPHRRRRLVGRRALPRARHTVRGLLAGTAVAAPGAPDPVRRLCGLGSASGCRVRCSSASWPTGRRSSAPLPPAAAAHRPAAAGGAEPSPGRGCTFALPAELRGATQGAESVARVRRCS